MKCECGKEVVTREDLETKGPLVLELVKQYQPANPGVTVSPRRRKALILHQCGSCTDGNVTDSTDEEAFDS